MGDGRTTELIGTFLIVVVVVLAATAAYGLVAGGSSGPSDGARIEGQSPEQFQPENVNPEVDPENGTITVDSDSEGSRILVDTEHENQFSQSQLEPVVEAAFRANHTLVFPEESSSFGSGDSSPYNETLKQYDGVLIIQPTTGFSGNETGALQAYADAGGRVVVLAEPTRTQVSGGGLLASLERVSFGANNMTAAFGVQMGAEELFNIDDEATDNNFKSIYAEPADDDPLTDGVETITFDGSGYAAIGEGSEARVLATAVEGTSTIDSRRTDAYPVVVRNGNMVFVADSSFVERSEIYDADNEVFISNLVTFLADGDLPDDYATEKTETPTATPTPPGTPPTPPETPPGTPPGTPPPTPTDSGA